MKVNIFKKLIRDIIREELDYKFSALEKKLDEVVVKSNVSNINEDSTHNSTIIGTNNFLQVLLN